MADTEKITINLGVVDMGQIDLLVEEGFYSNRTDFIRTAIRNQLDNHKDAVKQTMTRRSITVGAFGYSRKDLERARSEGIMLEIKAIGTVVITNDVPPDLARETIRSLKVFGVLRASQAVKEALADKIK
jgi:Arc/MetJ-type ribon-helix-helix transcriptional regulator